MKKQDKLRLIFYGKDTLKNAHQLSVNLGKTETINYKRAQYFYAIYKILLGNI